MLLAEAPQRNTNLLRKIADTGYEVRGALL